MIALTYALSEQLARGRQVLLSHLKVRRHQPDLPESETSMWYNLQARAVHLASTYYIFRVQLLVYGVVDPDVDVSPPEALFQHGRHAGDGAVVDTTHCLGVRLGFL